MLQQYIIVVSATSVIKMANKRDYSVRKVNLKSYVSQHTRFEKLTRFIALSDFDHHDNLGLMMFCFDSLDYHNLLFYSDPVYV